MDHEPTHDSKSVRIDDLHRCITAAFERLDLAADDAAGLAGLLVDTELHGHPDHGVAAIGTLASFYRDGRLNPRPQVRVLNETAGAILFDGDRGCGPSVPTRAMRWCVERAREQRGIAVAAVRDWQLLVAAPYARLAAEAGLIGFVCANFLPLVAPPGGRTAVFGTNPLAYAIPAKRHPTVVLDIATTVTSMQNVRGAAQRGARLPDGIIFNSAGHPLTDPAEFLKGGLLAPLGYPHAAHKGFGLALLIDALAGVLTGASFARGVGTGAPGNFIWALDIEAFMPREQFLDRMDSQLDQVQHGERIAGVDELPVPGERGHRRHAEITARGAVPISAASWRVLEAVCTSLGVPLPPVIDK